MKTYKQFIAWITEAYEVYQDDNFQKWASGPVLSYGLQKGYKPYAVVGDNKKHWATVLFHLNSFDKKLAKGASLKSGEKLYRYTNDKTILGDMMPFVKINIDKGLIYFLKDQVDDELAFDTKALKLKFARVVK